MTADSASGNAGATYANPTNTPASTPGAPAAAAATAPSQSLRPFGSTSYPKFAIGAGPGVPIQRGGAGVPHAGGTYANAVLAGVVAADAVARPTVSRSMEERSRGENSQSHPRLGAEATGKKYRQFDLTGGSNANDSVRIALAVNAIALTQEIDRAARAEEVAMIGQPPSTIEEFGQRAASMIEAVTTETQRRLDSTAAVQSAAPCGAPAASPTLAPSAAIAAAPGPGPAASTQQEDVDMAALDVAQARAVAANNAEQLVQAMHPPEAVVQTIPPRFMPLSANAPASSAPAAPAPTSVAASQGGAAGGSTACSADCFEAQRVAANKYYALEQRVAKLKQQLRDKRTEVKLLKDMVHPSSTAGGAGVAAPTALSSASSSAPSSAAQQRIAELEAQVAQLESHSAAVMRGWRERAGFFEEGDKDAEAIRMYWREQYLLNGGPAAAGKRIDRLDTVKQQVVSRDSKLKREGYDLSKLRIELEELEAQVKIDASKMGNDKQNKAAITKARSTARQAAEEKKRTQLALAQAALDAGNMRPTQQQLQASQEMEMRRLLSQSQQQLRLSAPCSSTPASPAGAGAGVAQPTPPSASRQGRQMFVDDEAEEASDDEAEQASETDSDVDDADDKQQPD